MGRQPLRLGRAAVPHVPAVPHVRALHALRVHPGARVLRAPGRVPRALPPGGEGARLGRGQPPVRLQRGPHAHRHGARHHGARRHQEGHVLRLTRAARPAHGGGPRAASLTNTNLAWRNCWGFYTFNYLGWEIAPVNVFDGYSLLRFLRQFPGAGNDVVGSPCF